ncbi:MAG TPA: S8 family peptidase [Blastocatellia bacterium]|nr:S8 family peptidase [Blastocatellia bacterium]
MAGLYLCKAGKLFKTSLAFILLFTLTFTAAPSGIFPKRPLKAETNQTALKKVPIDLQTRIARSINSAELQDVIVQFKLADRAEQSPTIERNRGRIKQQFDSGDTVLATVPVTHIYSLASEDNVLFITPDRSVQRASDAAKILIGVDKLRKSATGSFGQTYSAVDGTGVGIAIIDSGVSPGSSDLQNSKGANRIVASKDFTADSTLPTNNNLDDYGHGTSVAGVAAGNGWASKQVDSHGVKAYPGNYGDFSGVAPNANIISLKVIDSTGASPISRVIQAIDYAISIKSTYNIRVINLSLGGPVMQSYLTDPLCQAAERAVKAGIVVVSAAGNYGHNDVVVGYDSNGKPIYQTVYGSIVSPGNDPKVITVGAAKDPNESLLKWDYDGPSGKPYLSAYSEPPELTRYPNALRRSDVQVATFSSRGPTLVDGIIKPDIIAPGNKIIAMMTKNGTTGVSSLLPQQVIPITSKSANASIKAYVQYSGTSFSAPMVSGIAALMLQANPSLTPREIKAILQLTAQRIGKTPVTGSDVAQSLLSQGAGLVNAYAAVRLAQNIRQDANLAKAGDSLLKSGVTLTSLSNDLTLKLTDQWGYFLENGIFNSGFISVDGFVLSDGFVLADGFAVADGFVLSDGFVLADGLVASDGIIMATGFAIADGSVWPDGLVLGDFRLRTSCLETFDSQTLVMPGAVKSVLYGPTHSFYTDGIITSTGNVEGTIIFKQPSTSVWGNSVFDPTSMGICAGAEDISILPSNDDKPLHGVYLINKYDYFYPRQR